MVSDIVMSALQRWSCRFFGFLWAVRNLVFAKMSVSWGKSVLVCVSASIMIRVKLGIFGWYVTIRGMVVGESSLVGGVSVGGRGGGRR